MPLMYFGVLLPCRKDILQQRSTALTRATSFLHREYEAQFFYWEPLFLVERLCIVGFFQTVPEEYSFIRVLMGLILTIVYAMMLCALKPYKRSDLDVLAIASQFALVCAFVGATVLRLFGDLEAAVDAETAIDVTGFQSTVQIVTVMVVINLSTVVIAFVGITIQALTQKDIPIIRQLDNNEPAELQINERLRYHLFLSHIWSSGQDQAAIIKRQLQLLLPGVVVFLDVDDLVDIGNLEQYIQQTQCVLIFLSKGYFLSTNCKRELRQSLNEEKPLCLVHERDMNRGGSPIDTLREECPEECRAVVFDDREIIGWYRVAEFQVISLKSIAAATLHAFTAGQGPLPRLYVPGELSHQKLEFGHNVVLLASKANPGAKEAADEMVAQLDSSRLSLTTRPLTSQGSSRKLLFSSIPPKLEGSERQPSLSSKPVPPNLDGGSRSTGASSQPATHLAVYLNKETFLHSQGETLAAEIRLAWNKSLPILLLHENAADKGAVEFSHFFASTPEDLVRNGLYGQIAVALHPPPHRAVGFALAAKALGAKGRARTPALLLSERLSRSSDAAGELSTRLRTKNKGKTVVLAAASSSSDVHQVSPSGD